MQGMIGSLEILVCEGMVLLERLVRACVHTGPRVLSSQHCCSLVTGCLIFPPRNPGSTKQSLERLSRAEESKGTPRSLRRPNSQQTRTALSSKLLLPVTFVIDVVKYLARKHKGRQTRLFRLTVPEGRVHRGGVHQQPCQ